MKLAFSTLGCPDWTLERAAEAAVEYGYQGIELRILDGQVITPAMLRANRGRLRSLFHPGGIELIGLGTSVHFTASDAGERRRQEAELVQFIDLARDLGAPLVRIFGGRIADGATADDAVAWVSEGLRNCAPAAEAAGVTIGFETHDDFSRSTMVAAVLSHVDSPAVGGLWDTHHPYRMGEDVATVWGNLAARLAHVHIKDARRRPDGDWDLVLLGEGEVPCREIARALAMRGYSGWISAEWEKKWHPEIAAPEIALPQHIRKLREWLADVT